MVYIDVSRDVFSHFWHFITEEFMSFILLYIKQPEGSNFTIYRKHNENGNDVPFSTFDDIYMGLPNSKDHITITNERNNSANYSKAESFWGPHEWTDEMGANLRKASEFVKGNAPFSKEKYNIVFQHREYGRRSITNMEECSRLAEKELDANIYYWKSKGFWKDVALYKNVETVVMMHGAGMAHLMWMNQKKKNVLEFAPGSMMWFAPWYVDGIGKHFGIKVHREIADGKNAVADCEKIISILVDEFGYERISST